MCICEKDYYCYIENKMSIKRYLWLRAHTLFCRDCREDVRAWPDMKILVQQSINLEMPPNSEFQVNVMSKIYNLPKLA